MGEAARQPRIATGAEPAHPTFAEEVVVGAHRRARRHRIIGDDDVELVQRQPREEPRLVVLVADKPHGRGGVQRGLGARRAHDLGAHVGHADVQPHRSAGGPAAYGVEQLLPKTEDLVGVAVDGAADVGEPEAPSGAYEELLAQPLFERADLPAERRVAETEDAPRRCQTALARDQPEIEEVVIVQPLHLLTIVRKKLRTWMKVPYFSNPPGSPMIRPCSPSRLATRSFFQSSSGSSSSCWRSISASFTARRTWSVSARRRSGASSGSRSP